LIGYFGADFDFAVDLSARIPP